MTDDLNNNDKPPSKKNDYIFPKKIGVIYSDVKREYFPTEAQYLTEKDAYNDASIIASYLAKLNIEPILYLGNASLPKKTKT